MGRPDGERMREGSGPDLPPQKNDRGGLTPFGCFVSSLRWAVAWIDEHGKFGPEMPSGDYSDWLQWAAAHDLLKDADLASRLSPENSSGCDGSGYVGEFEVHGDAAKCSGCPACWSKDDWRILYHAASMAVQIYDVAEEEGGVPRSAPLYGKRDRLVELARGLDHTARHGLTQPDPQPEQSEEER